MKNKTSNIVTELKQYDQFFMDNIELTNEGFNKFIDSSGLTTVFIKPYFGIKFGVTANILMVNIPYILEEDNVCKPFNEPKIRYDFSVNFDLLYEYVNSRLETK